MEAQNVSKLPNKKASSSEQSADPRSSQRVSKLSKSHSSFKSSKDEKRVRKTRSKKKKSLKKKRVSNKLDDQDFLNTS